MVTRADIVREARKFIGTPFRHQGRVGGADGGIDCVGLCVMVGRNLGIYNGHDFDGYSRYPDGHTLMRELEKACGPPIDLASASIGDIVCFYIRDKSLPTHAGILTDLGFIHTYADVGRVVEVTLHDKWRKRIVAAFKYPGIGE